MKKKAFKMMLYLLCSFTLVSPMIIQAQTNKKDKPGTAIFVMVDVPCIMTSTKHIHKDSSKLYLDVKVPQVHGFSDKKFEKLLNHRFLQEGTNKAKTAIQNAETYNKQSLETNIPPLKFEYLSNFTIIESTSPYFVLEFLDYEYSGGAHGLSTQKYIVTDTLNNTEIMLKDLFKENTPYIERINAEITTQIKERTAKGEYFFTNGDGFTSIKDTTQFYIDKHGQIIIVFNVYEIAPYAAGAISFPINSETIKDILK
ncbi:DUF3298 and DUF4163 domain-containing protein [Cellulosilyticum ruminicola]|uniref:DUF3298 and DUF4163 domain-containing protein n=1 Tax=Cellulosilyticum ruminicola TaxID=425254 RepID=UPI0006CFA54B|nr:DUF3298 and DUF4163 domain-containing protein [Cellulosilyticum ruminicola]